MFFKHCSHTNIILTILLLCFTGPNIYAMDGILQQISYLINNAFDSVVAKSFQPDDNQPDTNIFYYEYRPVTEKSFNQLRAIAFEVYFDKSCINNDTDTISQEFTESLYNTWEEQFHKEHAQTDLETTTALAKIVKHHIRTYFIGDLQKTVTIEYNDTTAEFTDGMGLLLYDINRINSSSDHIEAKGLKIQW